MNEITKQREDLKFDSIIFDMDGTLWNATESYKKIWDVTFSYFGLQGEVSTEELMSYMGKPLDKILEEVTREHHCEIDKATFLKRIEDVENEMMPQLGGEIYEGVTAGIRELSTRYKLFMVSNCGRNGLRDFMQYAGLTDCFTDSVTYGENSVPKSENIKMLIMRHNLHKALYMGDTQLDCDEAHKAGIAFAYAKYGFGECEGYDMTFDRFESFVNKMK